MKLIKLASITKKLCIGALGAFLLIFLPFHMGMNLCILREDGGEWYRNVCHFMGTNYIVKVFEVILLACIVLHIVVTLLVTLENYLARPVRYEIANKSKTGAGSKYMAITGAILLVFLVIHFVDFYFAKTGWVEGKYVVKVEKVERYYQEKQMKIYSNLKTKMEKGLLSQDDVQNAPEYKELMELQSSAMNFQVLSQEKISTDGKYLVNLTKADVDKNFAKDFKEYEPDFYNMAKEKFKNPIYMLIYMLAFIILGIHLYHGVASVFQTYGLNVKKYSKAIDYLALIYAIVIPVGFALVPIIGHISK
ncbi:MAG: succinate dehydrogenase cytochrome b subunit [Bacteroidota bacterium]|nr:succinate dehydrogenase cytochrome b subunit [Bacteroidota bacterium]